eukprot:TRINITY_DN5099_c0_g1_i1.p1 TRINITY_DN5099_c0_g1~~TRINITY_DN5099_c0_g1_i1.p1  ORF type:complete len:1103 (+),score=207.46 TRINITY_DN5099_c0_g1_i1:37-3309(+)
MATWCAIPDMSYKRKYCAAAAVGESVFVFGGYAGNSLLDSAEKYDMSSNTWSALPDMGSARTFCAAAAVGETIFVFGGTDGVSYNSAEKYDLSSNTWSDFPILGSKRRCCAVVAVGDAIFVLGGYDGDSFLDSAEKYELSSNTWSALPSMCSKRGYCAAAAIGETIFVFGGYDGDSFLDSAEKYDVSSSTWSALPNMACKRGYCAAAAVREEIFVFGGSDGESSWDSAEKYDLLSNTWSAIPNMGSKREGYAAAALGETLFVFGGTCDDSVLDSAEKYDLSLSSPSAAQTDLVTSPADASAVQSGSHNSGELYTSGLVQEPVPPVQEPVPPVQDSVPPVSSYPSSSKSVQKPTGNRHQSTVEFLRRQTRLDEKTDPARIEIQKDGSSESGLAQSISTKTGIGMQDITEDDKHIVVDITGVQSSVRGVMESLMESFPELQVKIRYPLQKVQQQILQSDSLRQYAGCLNDEVLASIVAKVDTVANFHAKALKDAHFSAKDAQAYTSLIEIASLCRYNGELCEERCDVPADVVKQSAKSVESLLVDAASAQAILKRVLGGENDWAATDMNCPETRPYDDPLRTWAPDRETFQLIFGAHYDPGLKQKHRIEEKMKTKQIPGLPAPVQDIIDASRLGIIFDTLPDILLAVTSLKKRLGDKILWLDNKFRRPGLIGYAEVNIGIQDRVSEDIAGVEAARHHITEIRLQFQPFVSATQGEGLQHKKRMFEILLECGVMERDCERVMKVILNTLADTTGKVLSRAMRQLTDLAYYTQGHSDKEKILTAAAKRAHMAGGNADAIEKIVTEACASLADRRFKDVLKKEADDAKKMFILDKGIHACAQDGDISTLLSLLESFDVSVHEKNDLGETALLVAAKHGKKDVIQILLTRGADIEARDKEGHTALLVASMSIICDTVQLLLDRSADIEASDNCAKTSLCWAASKGNRDVVQLLLERDAKLEAKDKDGCNALLLASMNNSSDIVQALLDQRADIEAKDKGGKTALCWAARRGHCDVARLLLERSANIEARDDDGQNALHLASMNKSCDMLRLILTRRVNIESGDNRGKTALSCAVLAGRREVVQLLLEQGAVSLYRN